MKKQSIIGLAVLANLLAGNAIAQPPSTNTTGDLPANSAKIGRSRGSGAANCSVSAGVLPFLNAVQCNTEAPSGTRGARGIRAGSAPVTSGDRNATGDLPAENLPAASVQKTRGNGAQCAVSSGFLATLDATQCAAAEPAKTRGIRAQ